MRFLLLLVYFAALHLATSQDYYGVHVGKLRNASYALEGDVYLVNSTHLQIVDFTIKRLVDRTKLSFVFQNSKAQKRPAGVFEYRISNAGDWLRIYEKELRDGVNNKRLIVQIPGAASDWEVFGVWSDTECLDIKIWKSLNLEKCSNV
ncbi:hypothetical protein Y032_0892g2897 [Ancylostoma ceylanicum]|uniref:Uncharacterized protein n=1 Tax=Ancylostoma ceylanicum TaxID=53326 RepID=A0A016WBU8_9BILA|nr:hypothetical protein Y032_0892g2897 [Ancylostoma ceylanicum]